ncbi:DUF1380 domain-containing protein [Salmonella enterica]|nr:DUF1380 domain-containing protein [Salmonella enterica]ECU8425318.1 DUF1380 domain-containing protein [Salmonella enterica subsp. enterica serovar Javiana]ECG9666993.1 DUF1380 domain-containing protein [Salmonella enterica]ECG9761007.1 DUF1380 domain-containing protein [Salmonella enterica]ECH2506799.1 DUF1380 domain-containing protein [Salmonella enterica]
MYGTCETLCRLLSEQYPAETPMNLIVWTPEDIEALADGMECAVSDQDVKTVLARMDAIPEEQRLESGVSASAVMELFLGSVHDTGDGPGCYWFRHITRT